jgi:hypothetical protein
MNNSVSMLNKNNLFEPTMTIIFESLAKFVTAHF